jgi:hypothetical protein
VIERLGRLAARRIQHVLKKSCAGIFAGNRMGTLLPTRRERLQLLLV